MPVTAPRPEGRGFRISGPTGAETVSGWKDVPATAMLNEAMAFIQARHGDRTVFPSRIDRDEAGC